MVIMWNAAGSKILAGIDPKCPYVAGNDLARAEAQKFVERLGPAVSGIDPRGIIRYQDDVIVLKEFEAPFRGALNKLIISDKDLFERYAARTGRPFSTYSFVAQYLWTGLLDYYWKIIDDNFCLYCATGETIFMPLPPLGANMSEEALRESFTLMEELNTVASASRIEEIGRKEADRLAGAGYRIAEKGSEYICERDALALLAGDRYKAKRALCNHFIGNNSFEYRRLRADDLPGCRALFERWKGARLAAHRDSYYTALIEDSTAAHRKVFERAADLGLEGRVVMIAGTVAAYTFGYPLKEDTFVVLFEVADLAVKGLAQFIFREFCRELTAYPLINLMDDSGLANLRAVKLSYHPIEVRKSFSAYRCS